MQMRSNLARSAATVLVVLLWSFGARGGFVLPSGDHAVSAPGTAPITGGAGPVLKFQAPGQLQTKAVGQGDQPAPGTTPIGPNAPSAPGGPTVSPRIVGTNAQPAPGAVAVPNNPTLVAPAPAPAPAQSPPSDPSQLVVGIVFSDGSYGDNEICSGTLVDSTHILTAGHCGCGDATSYRIYSTESVYPPGKTDISQAGLGPLYYQSKPPVMFDPRLCGSGQFSGNDLALLELADGASAAIPAMNFGDPLWTLLRELNQGEKLLVVGYGYNNQNVVGVRNKDAIPIVSIACTERALARYCTPYAEMILAGAPGSTIRDDTCGGDSGGPVFKGTNDGYALLAVTSRSAPGFQTDPGKNCGGGGIYTILGRDVVQQWLQANGVQAAPWLKIGSP
jgi:hypothetical protein